jgi:hypothetical protein
MPSFGEEGRSLSGPVKIRKTKSTVALSRFHHAPSRQPIRKHSRTLVKGESSTRGRVQQEMHSPQLNKIRYRRGQLYCLHNTFAFPSPKVSRTSRSRPLSSICVFMLLLSFECWKEVPGSVLKDYGSYSPCFELLHVPRASIPVGTTTSLVGHRLHWLQPLIYQYDMVVKNISAWEVKMLKTKPASRWP